MRFSVLPGLAAVLITSAAFAAEPFQYPGDYYGRVDLPLPQAFGHLKRIIGDTDNFEPIKNFSQNNRYRQMAAPIGRLDLLVDDGGQQATFLCTGWVISRNYILTNHHCIPGQGSRKLLKASLLMNYLTEGDTATTRRFQVDTQPVETSTELDYSVVRIHGDPASKFGRIPLTVRDPRPNEELFVIQHPAGKPQRLTRRNCRADKASEKPDEIRHFCDTLGGSSGSPVFSDNDMALVGLHFAGIENKINFAKRMSVIVQKSALLRGLVAAEPGGGDGGNVQPPRRDPPPRRAPPQRRDPPPAGSGGGWKPFN